MAEQVTIKGTQTSLEHGIKFIFQMLAFRLYFNITLSTSRIIVRHKPSSSIAGLGGSHYVYVSDSQSINQSIKKTVIIR